MPITPHESIAGHRFSYNRHERHCGGVVAQVLRDHPPQARLTRPWPAHAVPRSSPLFAQRPRSTWVSLQTACQVVKPNVEELRARTRITGQVLVLVMQAGQTRSCGVRARTHKHPHTEMPVVGSHATCAAALPSGSPPTHPAFVTCDLSFQRSFGQLKIVNRPTPQTSALFSGPHRLTLFL